MFDNPNYLKIHVISCGMQNEINEECQNLVANAHYIFGSRTLLTKVAMDLNPNADHCPITAKAKDNAVKALKCARDGEPVVVLTSGDALYHGFGGTLVNCLNDLRLQMQMNDEPLSDLPELIFHPNITAFQQLFHKLGLAWSDAKLFSVHNGQNILPLRQFAESSLCVIYAGSRFTATDIAQKMVEFLPESATRPTILAEQLGTSNERIVQASLEEIATMTSVPTSILVLKPHPSPSLALPLGLPEEQYQRERNLITASDARAIILSRLRLPSQGLMWDIGAGSGSVGLEAAALRPELRVVAVERKTERAAMIEVNAHMLGVANHRCVTGDAVRIIRKLDGSPNRIFIGGGGADLIIILDSCIRRLAPDGLLLVSAVTTESLITLYQWRPELRRDVTTISIARETTIAGTYHHMRHQNTITLFTFSQ